ncbi:hypothetical protein EVAR_75912_1 [Eumeta japonica]|uniref:Uncharacterized protein n=1 Tax=Eumeta variegata TaxID=151549 RepID=A0A4C1UWT3_EUMVA|nr:hypothetical protein EVAR_75912_1 [Eumeta japonica]
MLKMRGAPPNAESTFKSVIVAFVMKKDDRYLVELLTCADAAASAGARHGAAHVERASGYDSPSQCVNLALLGKRACEPVEIKWPPPPMDTRNSTGVISALPASRVEIGLLMVGGVGNRDSHLLDEM